MPPGWLCWSEQALPDGSTWLTGEEREWSDRFRFTKRRIDYLLGRYVAKRAVAAALSLPTEPAALARVRVQNRRSGPARGAPEVLVDGRPAPVEISITDRAGWGVCVVGAPGVRLGCDLELVEPRSRAFVDDYLTATEAALVRDARDEQTADVRANLLWCAKESALKVLRTGLRRDTRSVEVTLHEAGDVAGWRRLTIRDRDARRDLPGWWQRFGDFLLTVASDEALPAPALLADEPRLAAARPSHAWMAAPRVQAGTSRPR